REGRPSGEHDRRARDHEDDEDGGPPPRAYRWGRGETRPGAGRHAEADARREAGGGGGRSRTRDRPRGRRGAEERRRHAKGLTGTELSPVRHWQKTSQSGAIVIWGYRCQIY